MRTVASIRFARAYVYAVLFIHVQTAFPRFCPFVCTNETPASAFEAFLALRSWINSRDYFITLTLARAALAVASPRPVTGCLLC